MRAVWTGQEDPPEFPLILYTLIETGARLGEICNLEEEDIYLEGSTPHIFIRSKKERSIKAGSSNRHVPLVGVAYEAMKRAPAGFPRYRDRAQNLSAALLKAMRRLGLCVTQEHVLYSFRHSFEDRMLEGGIDYHMRCRLMGHKSVRPQYGLGGSMKFKHSELSRIALSYSGDFARSLPWLDY